MNAYVLFAIALVFIALWAGFFAFLGRMFKVIKFIFKGDPPSEKPKKSTRKDYLN